jgi:hypothetical protein
MSASIQLFTEDKRSASAEKVRDCVALLAPDDSYRATRTIGPANWFELGQRSFIDIIFNRIKIPRKDISYQEVESASMLPNLYRDGSVLEIAFSLKRAPKLFKLHEQMNLEIFKGEGFNRSKLIFGPSDIVHYYEDSDGQPQDKLLAVSQFSLVLSWDVFRSGNFVSFFNDFMSSKAFLDFKTDVEAVTGPLRIYNDRKVEQGAAANP